MTKIKSTISLGVASFAALALVIGALAAPASAADVGSPGDADNPATWDQIVRIGSTSKITISSDTASPSPAVIPAVAGTAGGFGTVATQIGVSTNDSRGSVLEAQVTTATTADLTNGSTTSKVTALTAPGVLTTTANTWGYTFVIGDVNTVPTISSTFQPMPASGGTAVVLLDDNDSSGTQSGYINYGAVVDYSLAAGFTYETEVKFSASIGV